MARRLASPALAALALAVGLLAAPAAAKTPPKKAAKPAAKSASTTAAKKPAARANDRKSERASKGREKAGPKGKREVARAATSKKDSKRADRNARTRNDRQAASRSDKRRDRAERRQERASKNDRSASRNDRRGRREVARNLSAKELRRMSKRERQAHAAEQARRRREAAERARQAAIARALYLARIRAQQQALRDETQANIRRDETTGEDMEVRRVAVEALGNRAGSVVVMDPKTGRVYAVINQQWGLRKGFKPCSTIKLVTGLAGLSESVIDPAQTVNISTGSLSIDLTDSLAYSNNYYFQRVGNQVGFDRMMAYARQFGLGQPTGINHPLESPGRLPAFKDGYAVSHMSSHGDDIEVTPIQLANMAAAIANGGELLVPHLPRTPEETYQFKRMVRGKVNIPQEHLRRVVPGMIGAVNYGSGHTAYDPTQTIAGKTGTCINQDENRNWVGLFTSFAPVHEPKLAVAVVTLGSGERGKTAAAVAGKIYKSLAHRFGVRGTAPMLADENLIPRPKVDPSKAALLNEEEAEAEAEAGAQAGGVQNDQIYVVKEAGSAPASTPQTNVRSTGKVYEKPAVVAPSQGESRPRRVTPQEQQQ
jgi:penicillin-binding protein 2